MITCMQDGKVLYKADISSYMSATLGTHAYILIGSIVVAFIIGLFMDRFVKYKDTDPPEVKNVDLVVAFILVFVIEIIIIGYALLF